VCHHHETDGEAYREALREERGLDEPDEEATDTDPTDEPEEPSVEAEPTPADD